MGRKTRRARKPRTKKLKAKTTDKTKALREAKNKIRPYKSKFEYNIANNMKERGHRVRYEEVKLKYVVPASDHTYTPDFILDNGIIVEAKGHLDHKTRKKMLCVAESNPDLDIRFLFMNAFNKIYKGSPTTYAEWAAKHGFKWANKEIPEAWFNE